MTNAPAISTDSGGRSLREGSRHPRVSVIITVLIQLEQRLHADAERLGDPQRETDRWVVLTPLDREDRLARHTDPIGQLLLGQVVELPSVTAYVVPNLVSVTHSESVHLALHYVKPTLLLQHPTLGRVPHLEQEAAMRKLTMILLTSAVLAGCSQAMRTTDPATFTGTFSLKSIDGHPLPWSPSDAGGAPGVRAGTFTIHADGTFGTTMTFALASGTTGDRERSGTVTRSGAVFSFQWTGAEHHPQQQVKDHPRGVHASGREPRSGRQEHERERPGEEKPLEEVQ